MESTGIFYAQAGNGHRAAALALREALGEPAPLVDVLGFATPWFRLLCSRGYEALGERAHGPCGVLYRATDRLRDESALVRLVDRMSLSALDPFRRYVADNPVRTALCTHFLPLLLLARLREEGIFGGTLAVCITDFALHRLWVHREVDRYFCANTSVARQLADFCVPLERIRVTGIPVRLSSASLHRSPRPVPRDPLRVLFSAGSIPEGKVLRILDALGDLGIPLKVLLAAGRSPGLAVRLGRYEPAPSLDLQVRGFLPDLPRRMGEADLLVTKPGGLVASEALCAGVPLVLTSPIPLQETFNARYLEDLGAGFLEEDPAGVARRVAWYREDLSRLEAASRRARAAARPDAARTVIRTLRDAEALPILPRLEEATPGRNCG